MSTKKRNIEYSNHIANKIGLKLLNEEYRYGAGIGSADNHCYFNGWHIIFEIEYRQRHPEFNVSKVWPYLENHPERRIFLIQYVIDENEISSNRIIHSEWIANKMKNDLNGRFEYFLIKNNIKNSDIKELKNKLQLKDI